MPLRILLQLAIIALPFAMFGLYLLLTTAAEEQGMRKWPIKVLFAIGIALSILFWLFLVLTEEKDRELCVRAAYTDENGQVVPASEYPCERDLSTGRAPVDATGPASPDED